MIYYFSYAFNAAIVNVKIARKINELLKNILSRKSKFSQKVQIFRKILISSDSGSLSRHFDFLFTCLDLIVKL